MRRLLDGVPSSTLPHMFLKQVESHCVSLLLWRQLDVLGFSPKVDVHTIRFNNSILSVLKMRDGHLRFRYFILLLLNCHVEARIA